MDEIAKLGLSENEYQELLQQAVAVINDTRQRVAKQVNGNVTSAYWKIGKLLYERKIESTHGSGVVKRLSVDLKAQYPSMGLSTRQMCGNYGKGKSYFRNCRQVVTFIPYSLPFYDRKRTGHGFLCRKPAKNFRRKRRRERGQPSLSSPPRNSDSGMSAEGSSPFFFQPSSCSTILPRPVVSCFSAFSYTSFNWRMPFPTCSKFFAKPANFRYRRSAER